MPLNNAVGTVVLGADRGNIRAVLVAGEILKWDGTLVGVDVEQVKRRVTSTRDTLAEAAGYPTDLVGMGAGKGELIGGDLTSRKRLQNKSNVRHTQKRGGK